MNQPRVSVVMPIRNEADHIGASLRCVLEQDYPKELIEVFVIDGMSTDDTREIVQSVATTNSRVHLIDNPGRIVPKGLNRAMPDTTGDVIVRVDGHCEIASDYVSRCVEHLQRKDVDGVGGPIETIGETWMSRAIAAAMSSSFGVGGSAFRVLKDQTMLVDTIAFPAYTRAAIELAGPYDEELVRNQDDEYNYRLRKLGAKLLLASDVRSRYFSRASLRKLWKQYLQYGFWKVRVMQKHPRQMRARQFVPPLFVGALMLATLLAVWLPGGWKGLAALTVMYAFANLLASWFVARDDRRQMFVMPVILVTLHVAYGTGFLGGLLWFADRWPRNLKRKAETTGDVRSGQLRELVTRVP